jgi:hypothetical protein
MALKCSPSVEFRFGRDYFLIPVSAPGASFRLRAPIHGSHNAFMSKKALLILAASAELCLGCYFLLAFIGWCMRMFLFSSGQVSFSIMMVILPLLAACSFALYPFTRKKMRELDSK